MEDGIFSVKEKNSERYPGVLIGGPHLKHFAYGIRTLPSVAITQTEGCLRTSRKHNVEMDHRSI